MIMLVGACCTLVHLESQSVVFNNQFVFRILPSRLILRLKFSHFSWTTESPLDHLNNPISSSHVKHYTGMLFLPDILKFFQIVVYCLKSTLRSIFLFFKIKFVTVWQKKSVVFIVCLILSDTRYSITLCMIQLVYLISHNRATPRRIQWSGFCLVFKSTVAMYVRSVPLGFL